MEEPQPFPENLVPCGIGRTSCGDSQSPEFEFWMLRNPSFHHPNLVSADEIFSDGVLLPLHHLNISKTHASGSDRVSDPESSATGSADLTTTSLTSSKRWRDIFRKNDKKTLLPNGDDNSIKGKDKTVKERRREKKKNGVGGGSASSAELNINIWPFSRSRSAGNGGTRPRAAATRKVSSAPCSRSNSRGESKSKKLPSSPGRAGVHLGRSSPVWHVRRTEKSLSEGRRRVPVAGGSKAKVLSLHVPMCMGYRQQFSCSGHEMSTRGVGGGGGGGEAFLEGVRGGNLFNIRSLFTKKVY